MSDFFTKLDALDDSLEETSPQPVANGDPSPPSEGSADSSECYTCIVRIVIKDPGADDPDKPVTNTLTFTAKSATLLNDPTIETLSEYFVTGGSYTVNKRPYWSATIGSIEIIEFKIIKSFLQGQAECPPPNPDVVPNPEKPTPPTEPPPKDAPMVFDIDGCSGWPAKDNPKKLTINLSIPNESIYVKLSEAFQKYIKVANQQHVIGKKVQNYPVSSLHTWNYDPETDKRSRVSSDLATIFIVDPETDIGFDTPPTINNQYSLIWENGTYGILGDTTVRLPVTKKIVWKLRTGIKIKFEFSAECDIVCESDFTTTNKPINFILEKRGNLNFIVSEKIVFSRRKINKETGRVRFFAKIEDCTFKDKITGNHPNPATNCPQCAGLGKKDSSLTRPLINWTNPDKFEFSIPGEASGPIKYSNNSFNFDFSESLKTQFVEALVNSVNTISEGKTRECPCCITDIRNLSLKNGGPSIELVSQEELKK